MSTLTLVRHGQATPFERETDLLSPLGVRQARAVAAYWLASGDAFDEVYTGTLVRQQRTEEIVASAFHDAGAHWPPAQATAGWNEYDAPGVLTRLVPALADRDERFAALVHEAEDKRGTPEQNRYFQRMFEVAMAMWMEGVIEPDGVEPFHSFDHRVRASLSAITSQAGSRRVVVFTSGGPIGLLVQHILKAPARTFLDVNWRVRNCSLTEIVYGGGRISLDSFNGAAHLPRDAWSFR